MLGSVDAGELPGTSYHIKKMKSQQLKNKLKLKEKKRNQQFCSQVIHPSREPPTQFIKGHVVGGCSPVLPSDGVQMEGSEGSRPWDSRWESCRGCRPGRTMQQ